MYQNHNDSLFGLPIFSFAISINSDNVLYYAFLEYIPYKL